MLSNPVTTGRLIDVKSLSMKTLHTMSVFPSKAFTKSRQILISILVFKSQGRGTGTFNVASLSWSFLRTMTLIEVAISSGKANLNFIRNSMYKKSRSTEHWKTTKLSFRTRTLYGSSLVYRTKKVAQFLVKERADHLHYLLLSPWKNRTFYLSQR